MNRTNRLALAVCEFASDWYLNSKVFFPSPVAVGVYREDWQAQLVWWETTKSCLSE
jgi:hypothetical protein